MVANRLALIAVAALSVASCSFGITNNAAVEVSGDASADQKIDLAKSIISEVWDAGLKQSVLDRFGSVSEADLAHFGMRWNVMTFKPLTGGETRTKTTVHIQCSLRHRGGLSAAQEIAEFCEQRVREAMRQRGIEPPAAQQGAAAARPKRGVPESGSL